MAAPAQLVDALLDGDVEVLVCPTLIAELTEVLGREKFSVTPPGVAPRFTSPSCSIE